MVELNILVLEVIEYTRNVLRDVFQLKIFWFKNRLAENSEYEVLMERMLMLLIVNKSHEDVIFNGSIENLQENH